MNKETTDRRAKAPILWTLVVCSIIADQFTKAWFVFKLGYHDFTSFPAFLKQYFTLFADGNQVAMAVTHHYAMDGLQGVFRPPIWVKAPWFSWHLTTNTGAAWSMFDGNSFALSFVSLAMSVILFVFWYKSFRHHTLMTWAFGAIIGGALGNFFDRFRLREVVDFIDVKVPLLGKVFPGLGDPYDFPIFNIADSCAVCGTIALAAYLISIDIRGWLERRREKRRKAAEFTPLEEGLRLDEAAKARLRQAAGQGGNLAGTDLTRFVGDE